MDSPMHPVDSTTYLGQWGMQFSIYQQTYQFETCLLGFQRPIKTLLMDVTAENPCRNWIG